MRRAIVGWRGGRTTAGVCSRDARPVPLADRESLPTSPTHDESVWRGRLTRVDVALIYALFGAMALTLVVLAVGGMRR